MLSMLKAMQVNLNYDIELNYTPFRLRHRLLKKKKCIIPSTKLPHCNKFLPFSNQKILETTNRSTLVEIMKSTRRDPSTQAPAHLPAESSRYRNLSEEALSNDDGVILNHEEVDWGEEQNCDRGKSLEAKRCLKWGQSQVGLQEREDCRRINKFQREKQSLKPVFESKQLEQLIRSLKNGSELPQEGFKNDNNQSSENNLADTTIKSHPKLQEPGQGTHSSCHPFNQEEKGKEEVGKEYLIMPTRQEELRQDEHSPEIIISDRTEQNYLFPALRETSSDNRHRNSQLSDKLGSIQQANKLVKDFRQCFGLTLQQKLYPQQKFEEEIQMINLRRKEQQKRWKSRHCSGYRGQSLKNNNIEEKCSSDEQNFVFNEEKQVCNEPVNVIFKNNPANEVPIQLDLFRVNSTQQSESQSPNKGLNLASYSQNLHRKTTRFQEDKSGDSYKNCLKKLKKNEQQFYYKNPNENENQVAEKGVKKDDLAKQLNDNMRAFVPASPVIEEGNPRIWSFSDLLSEEDSASQNRSKNSRKEVEKQGQEGSPSSAEYKNRHDKREPESYYRHSARLSPREGMSESPRISDPDGEKRDSLTFQKDHLNLSQGSEDIKQLSSLRFDPRDGVWNQQTLRQQLELFLNFNKPLSSSRNKMNHSPDQSLSSSGYNKQVHPIDFNLAEALREQHQRQDFLLYTETGCEDQELPSSEHIIKESEGMEGEVEGRDKDEPSCFHESAGQRMEIIEELESNNVSCGSIKEEMIGRQIKGQMVRQIKDYRHHFHPREQALSRFRSSNPPLFKLDSSRDRNSRKSVSPCQQWVREVGEVQSKRGRTKNLDRFKTRLNKF